MISDESASDKPSAKAQRNGPTEFTIDLAGDRRHAENVIVEICAIAGRLGIKISDVHVTRRVPVRQKSTSKSKTQAAAGIRLKGRRRKTFVRPTKLEEK